MPDALIVKRFHGKEILPFIPELAELRIKIFRDYPYLYEGDLVYKKIIYKPILIALIAQ